MVMRCPYPPCGGDHALWECLKKPAGWKIGMEVPGVASGLETKEASRKAPAVPVGARADLGSRLEETPPETQAPVRKHSPKRRRSGVDGAAQQAKEGVVDDQVGVGLADPSKAQDAPPKMISTRNRAAYLAYQRAWHKRRRAEDKANRERLAALEASESKRQT